MHLITYLQEKLKSILNKPVDYFLTMDDGEHRMNDFLGKNFQVHYLHEINCIHCGRKTSKSFSQGFCYPCFTTLPQTDQGVIKPELNRAHEGISRDMQWSQENDLIDIDSEYP